MGKVLKAEKVEGRGGVVFLRCPRCGKLFRNVSDFNRHINKAHWDLLHRKKEEKKEG